MPIAATRLALVLVLCWMLAGGCAERAGTQPLQERLYAMGTWVDVTLGPGQDTVRRQALRDVEALLRAFERDYYPWTPGALADLNTAIAEGRETVVNGDLALLLRRAQAISRATDGLFEPGLGSLVELWGFHTTTSAEREPPSAGALAA
ncbi:MAG TPA: FAD:protein FMN transferase, partial [Gammaproteobacteria bacterium]|nr:FAD:protein FMN transferase [Gammaproteobacteria bacterium]